MREIITDYLDHIKTGRAQSYKNLALFPILSPHAATVEYRTLDEALAEHLITITEIDTNGSVPELKVLNTSPGMILIIDGEELVGAKQNRIINTTIIIQARKEVIIPVSCVEQGRWAYTTAEFMSRERIMPSRLRAMKSEQVRESVRDTGEYRSHQGAIWHGLQDQARRMAAESPSMAMSHIYEKETPSLQEYLKHFRIIDSQIGAVFMINGEVAGMDLFGRPDTFAGIFPKLVQSYAIDAIDWYESKQETKALKRHVTSFLKDTLAASVECHPSVGLGTDCRFDSKKITGFALIHDNQVIHLCVFAKHGTGIPTGFTSRMGRYSQRRRTH